MPHSIAISEDDTSTVYDLTTVAAVNAALGVDGNTEDDAETADEITANSKIIGEICDRVFASRDVVETFLLHECWIHGLPLTHYPVSAISSVTVGGVAQQASDYKVDPGSGLLWRWGAMGCYGWPRGEIVVSYTAGYDLPDGAPASLAQACIDMILDVRAIAAASAAGGGGVMVKDIQHGDRRVQFFDVNASASATNAAIPASVAALIAPFRRIVV